jgi:hypothetical protein
MLRRWRNIKYCDDGVSMYQCLSCYSTWRSQSGPLGWFERGTHELYQGEDGQWYVKFDWSEKAEGPFPTKQKLLLEAGVWRFCPYCGCEWDGEQPDGENRWMRLWRSLRQRGLKDLEAHLFRSPDRQPYFAIVEHSAWRKADGTWCNIQEWTTDCNDWRLRESAASAAGAVTMLKQARASARFPFENGEPTVENMIYEEVPFGFVLREQGYSCGYATLTEYRVARMDAASNIVKLFGPPSEAVPSSDDD